MLLGVYIVLHIAHLDDLVVLSHLVPPSFMWILGTDNQPHASCQPRVLRGWQEAQCPPLGFQTIQEQYRRSPAVERLATQVDGSSSSSSGGGGGGRGDGGSRADGDDDADGDRPPRRTLHPVLMDAFPHVLDGEAVFLVGLDYLALLETLNDTEWRRLHSEQAGAFFAHYRYTPDADVRDDVVYETVFCSIPDEFPVGARWHQVDDMDELFNLVVRCRLPHGSYDALNDNRLAVALEHVTAAKLKRSIRKDGAHCYEPILLCTQRVGGETSDDGGTESGSTAPVELLPLRLPPKPVALAVCAIVRFDALHDYHLPNYSPEAALNEWLSLAMNVMGVDHFFLYDTSVTRAKRHEMRSWLRHWHDADVITYVPWNFRGNRTDSEARLDYRHYAQIPAYDDCLWRFRPHARFFALIDTDELIVGRDAADQLQSILGVLDAQDSDSVSGFNFAGAYWGMNDESNRRLALLSAAVDRRERVGSTPSKSIVKATKVCASGIHYPYCTLEPMVELRTDSVVANGLRAELIHFRRQTLEDARFATDEASVRDTSLAALTRCVRAGIADHGHRGRAVRNACPRHPRVSPAGTDRQPLFLTPHGALCVLCAMLLLSWLFVRLVALRGTLEQVLPTNMPRGAIQRRLFGNSVVEQRKRNQ